VRQRCVLAWPAWLVPALAPQELRRLVPLRMQQAPMQPVPVPVPVPTPTQLAPARPWLARSLPGLRPLQLQRR
jgi:hypothetical protein